MQQHLVFGEGHDGFFLILSFEVFRKVDIILATNCFFLFKVKMKNILRMFQKSVAITLATDGIVFPFYAVGSSFEDNCFDYYLVSAVL